MWVEEPADTKDRAGIAKHFVKGKKFRAAGVWEGWGRLRPQGERLEVCHMTTLSAWTRGREEQKVLTLTVAVSLWCRRDTVRRPRQSPPRKRMR